MHDFLPAFIPLFVAVDVVALVPIYLEIGMPLDEAARRRLVLEATLTAAAVGPDPRSGGTSPRRPPPSGTAKPGPLPSFEERRPHHARTGSMATNGSPALNISSARTTAEFVFPDPAR
jgi:hypothetical protein